MLVSRLVVTFTPLKDPQRGILKDQQLQTVPSTFHSVKRGHFMFLQKFNLGE